NNSLLLNPRAAAFRADPVVQAALAEAKVDVLSVPTVGEAGNAELLADPSAFEEFDAEAWFNGRGFGFVRLQQLGTEHLLGAR
ncbi:MAG: xylose isomerase, partial [Propionicimonas sp.]|nr:xylose isomerase [Propionicimonas sp.]